jgi:DNA polymerase V
MNNKKSHGGFRPGAGRKSNYSEPTKPMRVPESQVGAVLDFLEAYRKKDEHKERQAAIHDGSASFIAPVVFEAPLYAIPVMSHRVAAGFPSPADDYIEHGIDLNEHLILHREATFILRVSGTSMIGAGIYDGDEIIVDRAIDPKDNHIVVAVVDNQLTVKRLRKSDKTVRLVAENPEYPDILIQPDEELLIWGVVTRVLHKV